MAAGVAKAAVGTDVDSVALWLAQRNAAAQHQELTTIFSPDPTSVPGSGLTVCNIPTHIDRHATDAFVSQLLQRPDRRLMVVIHKTIAARYLRRVAAERVRQIEGQSHVVLDIDRS
jgi:ribosomal protein L11 methylase PrmA